MLRLEIGTCSFQKGIKYLIKVVLFHVKRTYEIGILKDAL